MTESERVTILALHGFTGAGQDFSPFRDILSPAIDAPDLPGHTPTFDRSAAPTSFTEAVDAIGKRLHKPTILWGYSMGGRLALTIALRHPEYVRGLILVGASPGIALNEVKDARRVSDQQLAARIRDIGVESFLEEWRRHPLISTQRSIDPELRQMMQARRKKHCAAGLAYALEVLGTGVMPPVWSKLPRLKCPTLAVFGQSDSKYARIAAEMASINGRITPIEIIGAGHCAHLENIDGFVDAVRDFLAAYR